MNLKYVLITQCSEKELIQKTSEQVLAEYSE